MLFLVDALALTDGTSRTNQSAEVATHTLGAYQTRLTGLVVEDDGLMTAVVARHLTAPTTDAKGLVKLWIKDGVAVQMVGIHELWQLLAYELTEPGDSTLGHIALQTEYEVVDDAIAILHHGCAYLNVAAA